MRIWLKERFRSNEIRTNTPSIGKAKVVLFLFLRTLKQNLQYSFCNNFNRIIHVEENHVEWMHTFICVKKQKFTIDVPI